MTRAERLKNLYDHPMYGKTLRGLPEAEMKTIHRFIETYEVLGHLDFEYKINRMYLDVERPKQFAEVMDVLMAVNTPERKPK